MSDIKVNIIGEFQKKGFVQAEKATVDLSKNFDRLRRSARRTFTALIGYTALKQSVKAFAENDAAISNLTKSLDNLGFRFEAPGIVTYLENLEKTTAVVKEDLFPAFRNLANATLDTAKAQELLNVALDISAGTGAELGTVTTALTRAYNGNFASLGKIQNAYTMAELKAMGFSQSVQVLQDQFSGQAAASADTYQAKITRLNIALGDAAEAIGKGVVDALEALGGGNYDRGLELIAGAGEKVGDAFRFAATSVAYFQRFWKQGLFSSKDQLAEFRRDMDAMFREDPAKARTQLRERAKYLAVEARQTEKIRKERAAAAKLAEKEKKNQIALTKAKAMFDLEKIQIEAALQGKITEEERTRLLLMKAIAEENGTEADRLTEKLQQIQADTMKLAETLTSLKAGDPFSEWDGYFANAKKLITDLFSQFKEQQALLDNLVKSIKDSREAANANVLEAKTDKATAYAEAAKASGNFAALATQDAATAVANAAEAIANATTPEEKIAAETSMTAALGYVNATDLLTESVAAADLAAALADLSLANEYLNQSIEGAIGAGVPVSNIYVTVEGSVTAAEDLAEIITDIQYEYQRSGKNLRFSSIAI
jgi:hypothetical protein